MSRPVFLTTDWDFFIWDGGRSKITVFPGDPEREDEIPGIMLFDWGHGESFGELLAKTQWLSRRVGFNRVGLDVEKVVSIDLEKGCTDPIVFNEVLREKLNIEDPLTFISDSHLFAYMALQHIGEAADVINFDAHCDLGYDDARIARQFRKGEYDCASWAIHALEAGIAATYTVVYPDWLKYGEWEEQERNQAYRRFGSRIRATTWSEWKKKSAKKLGPVEVVHHARSSNWTPPYLDEQFIRHAHRLGSKPYLCFDCGKLGPYAKVGVYDACKPRDWWPEIVAATPLEARKLEEAFGALNIGD